MRTDVERKIIKGNLSLECHFIDSSFEVSWIIMVYYNLGVYIVLDIVSLIVITAFYSSE